MGELASALSEGAGFSAAAGAGAGAAGADRWRGAGGYPKDAGYKAIAIDVQSLAALLESRWSVVRGKAAVTLAELHQHGARASEPLNAIGQKDLAEPVVGEAAVRCKRKALDTEKDAVSDCKNDAGGEGVERWRHRPPSSRSRTR